jgi:glyoxylase-like metal-dependent hydrolase (beta-lactamase superfamily II)
MRLASKGSFMRVHHLNCATFCPRPGRLIAFDGGLFSRGKMICHCLLIESDDGLILVDTGIGTEDVRDPHRRLGALSTSLLGARLDVEETALRRVERMGFRASDVRHIVPTHLDLDHAGGLPDFPAAKVHIYGPELDAAMERRTRKERSRYRTAHWAHKPSWVRHTDTSGERWFGFERVRALPGVAPEVLLIPLTGHTRGHSAVAVKARGGWLVHAGDAYFHHAELEANRRCPIGLDLFQAVIAMNNADRLKNQARLRELAADRAGEVRIFCAHDPVELEREQAEAERARRAN